MKKFKVLKFEPVMLGRKWGPGGEEISESPGPKKPVALACARVKVTACTGEIWSSGLCKVKMKISLHSVVAPTLPELEVRAWASCQVQVSSWDLLVLLAGWSCE